MHVNDKTPANGANDEMQHCRHLDIAVAAETDLIGEKPTVYAHIRAYCNGILRPLV